MNVICCRVIEIFEKEALIFLILLPILLMAQSNKQVTADLLRSFADAFNAHDVKAVMSHMTDDCVFEASSGPDIDGEKYTGQAQVSNAFENVFTAFRDASWGNARHFISGNRGFSEWTFTGTRPDGTRVEVNGCDLFTFKNGKIVIKNSFRKNRLQAK